MTCQSCEVEYNAVEETDTKCWVCSAEAEYKLGQDWWDLGQDWWDQSWRFFW